MKRAVLLLCLSLLFVAFQRTKPTFSGKWKLDLKKSKNLPSSFKSVERYSMEIRQTSDSMVVSPELRGGGQDVKFPVSIYVFNGKEIYHEDTLRLVKRWYSVKWLRQENKFSVTSRVEQHWMKDQRYSEKDVWEIRNDGSLQITMTQKFEPNDSTYSQRRYFYRTE